MNVRDSDSSGSPSPEPKRQRIADIDWASAPPWQYEWWVGARVMAQFVGRGGPDTQFAGRWFPGEVTAVDKVGGTVDLLYADDAGESVRHNTSRSITRHPRVGACVRVFTPSSPLTL